MSALHRPVPPITIRNGVPAATLIAGGDIALINAVADQARDHGPDSVTSDIAPFLRTADLRIANLEVMFTSCEQPIAGGGRPLKASPEMVQVLQAAEINAVTLANNHARDFRQAAVRECVGTLRQAGILFSGAGESREAALQPAIVEVKGVRIAMLGFCDNYRVDLDPQENVAPQPPEHAVVIAAIASAKQSADLVILQLHWGYEFELHPPRTYRDRARAFADAGADLVLCHHAHVPMGVERWGNSIVAHGLGDFIFAPGPYLRAGHPWTDRGVLLKIGIDRLGVVSAELVAVNMEGGRVVLASGRTRSETLGALAKASRRLHDDDFLDQIERHRIVFEATTAVQEIAKCRSDDELLGWTLRLRSPFRQQMISGLRSSADHAGCRVADLLQSVADGSVTTAASLAASHELSEAVRTLQRSVHYSGHLPGRLP